MDSIESLRVVAIDGYIASEELGMILGLDSDIATIEERKRLLTHIS